MIIDGCVIGGQRCYTVAELGHNHGGSIQTAVKMVRAAAAAGVDAVKLQKRDNATLFTRAAYDAPYTSENAYGPTYGLHRDALEFGWPEFCILKKVAAECNVTLFATAFDTVSLDFCVRMGLPAVKIASGDLTNIPLIQAARDTRLPLLISTGGGELVDVDRAIANAGLNVAILQCTAMYPCPPDKLDLGVIATFRDRYPDLVIGFSNHFNGISPATVAYTLGARIIETHFTLDRTSRGTDHAFSLEPQGLRKLVRDLRRSESAIGDGIKRFHAQEGPAIRKMAKGLYTARPLPAGHILDRDDLLVRSPGGGLPPYLLPDLIGRTLTRDLDEEAQLGLSDVAEHTQAVG